MQALPRGLAVLLEAPCVMVWPWGPGQAAVKGLCGWPLGGCSPLLRSCIYISALGLGLFLSCTAAVTPRILMRCAGSTPGLSCHHGWLPAIDLVDEPGFCHQTSFCYSGTAIFIHRQCPCQPHHQPRLPACLPLQSTAFFLPPQLQLHEHTT